jgi:hypothetical protein
VALEGNGVLAFTPVSPVRKRSLKAELNAVWLNSRDGRETSALGGVGELCLRRSGAVLRTALDAVARVRTGGVYGLGPYAT